MHQPLKYIKFVIEPIITHYDLQTDLSARTWQNSHLNYHGA
jgi:hypothetical protein